MSQKYPKFQKEYEDEYWRGLATKQQRSIKFAIIGIALIAISIPVIAIYGDPIKHAAASLIRAEKEKPFPGGATQHFSAVKLAPFTVNSSKENCVVKLSEWNSSKPVLEIYVAGNDSATTKVKLGKFRTTIACGKSWKGRERLFGRGTRVTTGIEPLIFDSPRKNEYTGHILSLTEKIDGNYKTVNSISQF